MAKMTNKEFKRILNESGLNFDIMGYEGILNLLSMCHDLTSLRYEEEGKTALAEIDRDISNKIFDELEKIGYYKD